jgi:hypothetical protein
VLERRGRECRIANLQPQLGKRKARKAATTATTKKEEKEILHWENNDDEVVVTDPVHANVVTTDPMRAGDASSFIHRLALWRLEVGRRTVTRRGE